MATTIIAEYATENGHIPANYFRPELKQILAASLGSDYAWCLAHDDAFFALVKTDVEETSEWKETRSYNDDDIRLAIGRAIMYKFGIEY